MAEPDVVGEPAGLVDPNIDRASVSDSKRSPKTTIRIDIRRSSSSTEADVYARSMHDSIIAVRRCYDSASAKWPAVTGYLIVQIFVGTSGKRNFEVYQATNADPDIKRCVTDLIGAIPFPKGESVRLKLRINANGVFGG